MSMTCTICASPDSAEVERLLVLGRSMRSIAVQYGLSATSVARHRNNGHVPAAIVVGEQADRETHAVDLAGRVEFLWRRAGAILDECEGRPALQLAAVRELRAVCELLARLIGALELQERGQVLIELTLGDSRTPWPRGEMVEGNVIPGNVIGPKGSDSA